MACRSCCYVISKETTILLRGGGGGPHISMAGFFAGTSAKYFSFPVDHFHLTVKGVIKISPQGSYTGEGDGGGCPSQQNFLQQPAPM